ncbi:calnexin 99A isoform X2 [Rhodnius prolixus]
MKKWLIVICLCWVAVIKADDNFKKTNRLDTDALNKIIADKNPHFVEDFNNKKVLNKKWIVSTAKKEGIEADLAAYDGDWLIDAPMKYALLDDFGLLFKQRAKHRAISALLKKDFVFEDTPFVLQYEVHFQEGQECGGGYIKLVSGDRSTIKLHEFHDKTPYTIMFGPDKCGSTSKVHFIFRHKNPLNGSFEEKHMKPMANRIDEIFSDGKPHLFGLVLLPDNSYKILIDHKVVNEGSLLNDFTPPVNPPAEIDDPTDIKPENWDDREMIPDPLATKPVDWDEDAPATIQDPLAIKPDSWLDHEPLYISDPSAEKPHDWDAEMDGEWEAPLVPNPACEDAAGCGEWTPPSISNPAYKGKWTPPLIPNPDYKGKWTPRKIPNADYFEDKTPFKMAKIVAVGFELWSMSPSILFDNILLTDSEEFARMWAQITYDVKIQNIEQSADTFINQFIAFTNRYPWLWAMYTVLLLILVTLIVYCCFWNVKDNYEHKKTDAILPDDSVQSDDSAQSEDLIQSGTSSDQPAEETKSSVKTDIAEVVSSESDVEADATETQGENEKTIEGGVDI